MKKNIIGIVCFLLHNVSNGQKLFTGQFFGEQQGIISSADLKSAAGKLTGSLIINGKKGTVSGTITDTVSNGTIHDIETGTNYVYKAYINAIELHFIVTFPEFNNLDVDLVMQKQTSTSSSSALNNKPKDGRLVGLWRYTEIISSGSGGNYGSFSTDYFMEFKADGTVLSWTGSSAGGAGDVTISGTGNSKTDKGHWYTEGKNLVFVDPATNQKLTTLYYAEANRIMLHNGGNNKRVWERVR